NFDQLCNAVNQGTILKSDLDELVSGLEKATEEKFANLCRIGEYESIRFVLLAEPTHGFIPLKIWHSFDVEVSRFLNTIECSCKIADQDAVFLKVLLNPDDLSGNDKRYVSIQERV